LALAVIVGTSAVSRWIGYVHVNCSLASVQMAKLGIASASSYVCI